MSRNKLSIISVLSFLFLLYSCASYEAQYNEQIKDWNSSDTIDSNNVGHTFYLIGDAGKADSTLLKKHYQVLQKELKESSENATLLFLGDNIYDKGMPKKRTY